MNYQKIYDALIHRAQNRILNQETYCEIHHIIPRCLSGTDHAENLVRLTLREHFFAHLVLCKIYPDHIGLYRAVFLMSNTRELKNSKDFSKMKSTWARLVKNRQQLQKIKKIMSKAGNIDYNKEFSKWWNNSEWMTHHELGEVLRCRPKIKHNNLLNEDTFKKFVIEGGDVLVNNHMLPNSKLMSKSKLRETLGIGNRKARHYRKLINAAKTKVQEAAINDFITMGLEYYNKGENNG